MVDITENTDTKRRKSSRKSSKKTECPNCLSYVLPRDLDKHMKYECEARLIRCRFYPQCQCQPFPANEREEHRKFCRIAAKRRKILKHKKGPLPCPRCGSTERPHLECPKEQVSCPHCSEKVLRCELNTQHHLKTCSILVKRDELARLYVVVSCVRFMNHCISLIITRTTGTKYMPSKRRHVQCVVTRRFYLKIYIVINARNVRCVWFRVRNATRL